MIYTEIQREVKVIEFIEYDGIRFYRDQKGYWLSGAIAGRKSPVRLHVYVWEKYNGEIPKGYHIHHIDMNTDNNEIENLAMLEEHEHYRLHAALQNKEQARYCLQKYAKPKAAAWHGSADGIEWHKQHYQQMKERLHKKVTFACAACGKLVTMGRGGCGNKFCSGKCKATFRRRNPEKHITKTCDMCGSEFLVYDNSSKRFCSPECRKKYANENKKH